ncbi:MAG: hypothetical protein L0Z53_24835, partial [Acidobacteriales bacterium]|nr:hypothetical protein [Terriglobales bacterium]
MLRWFGIDGRRYGETVGDIGEVCKRDAQRKQRAKQSEFDGGKIKPDKPKRMSLTEFQTFHADLVRSDLAAGTMLEYKHAFAWAEKIIGKDGELCGVTALHVAKIRNAMADEKREPPTIHKTLAYLRAAFNRAKAHNLLRENPFEGFTVKNASKPKDAVIRTREEIRVLKSNAADAWWKAAIGLWFAGMRQEEALALQWSDVNFAAKQVTIRKSKAGEFELDGKTYPILAWQAKTENSYRMVPIPADTLLALRELADKSDGSVYVFLSLARLQAIKA